MREYRGKPVVVTFMYSHCKDTCPVQAQQIKGALDDIGHDLPALSISVDPPGDTPKSVDPLLAVEVVDALRRVARRGDRDRERRQGVAAGVERAPDLPRPHRARVAAAAGPGTEPD